MAAVDIGGTLKQGVGAFFRDALPLMAGALLTLLLGSLTFGILMGPMLAGLFLMALRRIRDGRTPEIGDVFSRFDRFFPYLLAFYGIGILTAIGYALLVVPGLYLSAIWFYALPLMVDRGLGVGDAMGESRALVDKAGIGAHFGLVLVLVVIGAVICAAGAGVLSWLGPLVMLPLFVTTTAVAYCANTRAAPLSASTSPEPTHGT